MSRFRKFEMIDHTPSLFLTETSVFAPKCLSRNPCFPSFSVETQLDLTLDLLNPVPAPSLFDLTSPFEDFDPITDLIYTSTRKAQLQRRVERLGTELYLHSLCDRVSALELGFDQIVKEKSCSGDRKYTWTAEINSPEKDGVDRKYKLTTEIKGGKTKEKSYEWKAEIKGKGENAPISRKYTFKASSENAAEGSGSEKKEKSKTKNNDKKSEKAQGHARLVEIEECPDHRAVVLRQAFAKRAGAVEKNKGKRKELSPQDAALMIQMTFRAYLIRRSQALRALRELAVAKAKLKEIRALFNNFSYRRRLARDAEEKQRFSERIIVLLLTVDAIEGADIMVRAARRSMVDELEAMLDVVDPQSQGGRSLSMKRRTFDMPDGVIQKELAAGVAQVVRMLDQEPNCTETFEACL